MTDRFTSRLTLILYFFLIMPASTLAAVTWFDGIVATVGTDIVTQSELQHEGFLIQKELQARNTPLPSKDQFINQVLDRLILKKIQLQRAANIGIKIDDNTLNNTIENIASENRLNLSQFRKALVKEGIDYTIYRSDIRDELTIQSLLQRDIYQKIKVTDTEIENLLRQQLGKNDSKSYRLSHILISLSEAATSDELLQAKNEVQQILDKLNKGEDFSSLAIAHSDGQRALKGGDLGWRNGDQLPTIFASVVPALKQGQVSETIRSPSGFHLVKLIEVKQSSAPEVTETHARHILIKDNPASNKPTARTQLLEIIVKLDNGGTFSTLAEKYSEDKGSAVKGGDLGWAPPGTFVPVFEETISRLKKNEVSQPFKSQFGWHIVQLLDSRKSQVSEESLKKRAKSYLFKQKQEEAEQLWLRRLRDEAYVEIHES